MDTLINTEFIISCLKRKYSQHKYILSNSFVYSWESDFFSELKSGYHQEIEVKVSRADFLADFKKEDKHRALSQKLNKCKLVTFKSGTEFKVRCWEYEYLLDSNGRRIWDNETNKYKLKKSKIREYQAFHKENINDKDIIEAIPIKSSIYFKNIHTPNRFYYCCPKDLIDKNEVPEYAGLLYTTKQGEIITVKNAPLIHKEKRDLSKILLDKFYWLSINLENRLKICTGGEN